MKPWQMMRDDYNLMMSERALVLWKGDRRKYRGVTGLGRAVGDACHQLGGPHSEVVRAAIAAGLPVPPAVIEEYDRLRT